eukprot:6195753-Pleurochrysis_carterae.AAC.3
MPDVPVSAIREEFEHVEPAFDVRLARARQTPGKRPANALHTRCTRPAHALHPPCSLAAHSLRTHFALQLPFTPRANAFWRPSKRPAPRREAAHCFSANA